MKTHEEIVKLAYKEYGNGMIFSTQRNAFIKGYAQRQKDETELVKFLQDQSFNLGVDLDRLKLALSKIRTIAFKYGCGEIIDVCNPLLPINQAGEPANDVKGAFNGKCNITACTTNLKAVWYNHSTRLYYCEECAERLNNDSYNKRDAMRLYGHDLCTKGEHV